jgi:hypothetical protein
MTGIRQSVGPWPHRLLIYCFSVLFAVLVYWLLGFIVTDIATWPGPDYPAIQNRIIEPG